MVKKEAFDNLKYKKSQKTIVKKDIEKLVSKSLEKY